LRCGKDGLGAQFDFSAKMLMKPSLSSGGAPILASNFIKLSMPLHYMIFKEADRIVKQSLELAEDDTMDGCGSREHENVVVREERVHASVDLVR